MGATAAFQPPRLRVLHVCEPTYAGAALVAYNLATGLRSYNVEPVVCTPEGNLADWCRADGVPVVVLPFARRSPRSYVTAIRLIRRMVSDGQFSLVHAHSSFSGLLVRIARGRHFPPVVFQPNAWSFQSVGGFARRLVILVERSLATRTDLLLCVSSDELAIARRAGIHARQALVIPNAVDFGVPVSARSSHAPGDAAVVGSLTRLTMQKGVDVLVRAVSEPAWPAGATVEILGDGPLHDELVDLAKRLGVSDRIHFVGYVHEVRPYLDRWDVFVLPSRYEGLPVALLEALAAGLPVVVTAIGGVRDVIADGAGVVPPDDPPALARAVRQTLSDWPTSVREAERLRQAASERYSMDAQLERIARAYDAIATRRTLAP